MDEKNHAQQIFDKPQTTAPNNENYAGEVFVMPKEYRGATLKESPKVIVREVAPVLKSSPVPVMQPKVDTARAGAPTGAPARPKAKGKFPTKLVVIGLAVIGLFGGFAAYMLSTLTPEESPSTEVGTPFPQMQQPTVPETEVITPETETTETTEPQSPFEIVARPGIDTDSDGITDIEETLYKTNARLPDTDSDGFLDGNEVFNGYNPALPDPSMLIDSALIKVFENETYKIAYPAVWIIESLGTAEAVFTASTGEKIKISIQPRDLDFWAGLIEGVKFSKLITKQGYNSAVSEDQLKVGIDGFAVLGEAAVAELIYSTETKPTVEYLQTFKMMINSFQFKAPQP